MCVYSLNILYFVIYYGLSLIITLFYNRECLVFLANLLALIKYKVNLVIPNKYTLLKAPIAVFLCTMNVYNVCHIGSIKVL